MFPIRWNFPFRKKNGALSTIGDEIENAGGSYVLPTASAETKGGIKVGDGLTIDNDGVLSASGGGSAIGYVDIAITRAVTAGSGATENIQATAGSPLIGKRIISVTSKSTGITASATNCFPQHDPIQENDWIVVMFYNTTTSDHTVYSIRIWYA